MKQASTVFLRIAIIGMAGAVLALCTLLLPQLWNEIDQAFPSYATVVYIVFIAMYVAAIPYFIGLIYAWRLLTLIDKGLAFSLASAKTIRAVTVCAGIISAVYIASLPFFYQWADKDDAPGLVIIGMVLAGMPMVIAVCAALLGRLVREAVEIKSENDLTV